MISKKFCAILCSFFMLFSVPKCQGSFTSGMLKISGYISILSGVCMSPLFPPYGLFYGIACILGGATNLGLSETVEKVDNLVKEKKEKVDDDNNSNNLVDEKNKETNSD